MKDIKKVFSDRRSINYFDKSKKIDDKILKDIMNMAVLAPSSFNLQPWEVIVVKSDHAKKKLYEEACNQKKVLDASANLVIVGNTIGYKRDNIMYDEKIKNGLPEETAEKIIETSENDLYPTQEKKVAFAVRNSSLLAMSIMYAAKYYDVDTHPMIGFNEEKVKELFDIQKHKTVTMIISIGYHDDSKEIKPRERRLQYDEIVKEY